MQPPPPVDLLEAKRAEDNTEVPSRFVDQLCFKFNSTKTAQRGCAHTCCIMCSHGGVENEELTQQVGSTGIRSGNGHGLTTNDPRGHVQVST